MATITEDYVSFEIAKLLKEKRFNEPTLAYAYGDDMISYYSKPRITDALNVEAGRIPLPTIQMAMKYLREIHHIHIRLINSSDESYRYEIYPREGKYRSSCFSDRRYYETYEKAAGEAIKYCLKNII